MQPTRGWRDHQPPRPSGNALASRKEARTASGTFHLRLSASQQFWQGAPADLCLKGVNMTGTGTATVEDQNRAIQEWAAAWSAHDIGRLLPLFTGTWSMKT